MTNQAAQTIPKTGGWIAADYVYPNARAIDVALNGEAGAASRPMLCDVVAQIVSLARKHGPLTAALSQPAGVPFGHAMFNAQGACVGFRQNNGPRYNYTVDDFAYADKIMPDGAPHTGCLVFAAAPAASGGEFVTVPRELTPSMLEAAEQEEACGNDFPEMWEAAIATYIFDKENGNG